MFALIFILKFVGFAFVLAVAFIAVAPCILSSRISRDEERRDFIARDRERAA